MEHKQFLEEKLKELTKQFKDNAEIAQVLVQQRNSIEQKLKILLSSGTQIAAKVAAINDMLKEQDL